MSARGDIIRGAGGYLNRNTHLGIGIGHPHGGEEGDIRIQMVDSSPHLYARAGGQWYGINLASSVLAGGASAEVIIGSMSDHIKITPEGGMEVISDDTNVAGLGKTLRVGRIADGASRLEVSAAGQLSIINRQGTTDTTRLLMKTDGAVEVTDIGVSGVIKLIDGQPNVIIGDDGGDFPAGGTNSVLIGTSAGAAMIAGGSYNIAIGYEAGKLMQKADYNILIGREAGEGLVGSLTNASNNLCIGREAGKNLTTGSNNVIIGRVNAASATGDDQLAIASGEGDVTWLTGTSAGLVTIPGALTVTGTFTPSSFIQVYPCGADTDQTNGDYLAFNQLSGEYPERDYDDHEHIATHMIIAPYAGYLKRVNLRAENATLTTTVELRLKTGTTDLEDGSTSSGGTAVSMEVTDASNFAWDFGTAYAFSAGDCLMLYWNPEDGPDYYVLGSMVVVYNL